VFLHPEPIVFFNDLSCTVGQLRLPVLGAKNQQKAPASTIFATMLLEAMAALRDEWIKRLTRHFYGKINSQAIAKLDLNKRYICKKRREYIA